MGTTQKSDGRYIVGKGISNANEYKGSMGYRDIVIQLTESGATAESVQKLNYLKDYALYHSEKGEPIIPPNTQIWISGNGFSKAVEADDIDISESEVSIGGIVYSDGAWDYSNAGQGGGGSGGGNLVVHASPNQAGNRMVLDKTWNEINTAFEAGITPILIYQDISESYYEGYYYTLMDIGSGEVDDSTMYAVIFARFVVNDDDQIGGERWMFTTDSADGYPDNLYEGDNSE